MIQDILPHRLDNAFKPRLPETGDYILIYGDDKVLLLDDTPCGNEADAGTSKSPQAPTQAQPPQSPLPTQAKPQPTQAQPPLPTPPLTQPAGTENLRLPQLCDFMEIAPACLDKLVYLFHVDESAFFYVPKKCLGDGEIAGFVEKPSGSFRTYKEKWLAFCGITACHLAGWYELHRICGKCGTPTKHGEKERMLECPLCRAIFYPRISPVVIVGVTDGRRLLLTRYANRPGVNYALVAGFCEIGESIEGTVRREVMEEVGLRVTNLRFYKSQPWGFSGSLLFGFYCDLDGDDKVTVDQNELAEAKWMERGEIPAADTSISLTSEMIESFRIGLVN